jgi:cytochrome c-type biogenesis protein CcmH/NrfF
MASPPASLPELARAAAAAQGPAPQGSSTGAPHKPTFAAEQAATALSNELMSPFCPGRTLSACPSENARKVERWMAAEFDAGRTKEEIKADLEVRFGDRVGTQIDGTILAISGGLALLGLFIVLLVARRWRPTRAAVATDSASAAASSPSGISSSGSVGGAERDAAPAAADRVTSGNPLRADAVATGARAGGVARATSDELDELEAELERIDRL